MSKIEKKYEISMKIAIWAPKKRQNGKNQKGVFINKLLSGQRHLSQWRKKGRELGTKRKLLLFLLMGIQN
jgi:hypothetical protein